MIKLPRLYVGGKFEKILHPISASITQNILPLDSASLTLPSGEELPPRSYVEMFTPYGSAGMFRVRNPHDAYGQETTTAELEHLISEVGDYLVKEEISEMLMPSTAIKRVFKYYEGGLWKLGSFNGLGSSKIACEAKYDRVLDSILSIIEQTPNTIMTFDFKTTPWTINFVKKSETATAEGRLARNVKSATITYDDTELCTRLWYQTYNKKKEATWKRKDSDTKKKYGIVEGKINTSSDMTDDEITSMVDTYIEEHKEPRVSINIQADYLSEVTGESMDRFKIGDLFRLNLVDYKMVIEKYITSMTWNDVYGNPRSVSVTLGDEEDTVVTFLHNLDATGSGGGGGGKAKDDAEEGQNELQNNITVQWEKTDTAVVGLVSATDKYGNILEQAGLTLNKDGLLVYVKDKPNGLYHQFDVLEGSFTSKINNAKTGLESAIEQTDTQIRAYVDDTAAGLESSITVNSNKISLVVTEVGGEDVVNAASIVLGINNQDKTSTSYVDISADKINLTGYVTASQLSAVSGKIDNFMTGYETASKIVCDDLRLPGTIYYQNKKFTEKAVYDIYGNIVYCLGRS